MQITTKHKNYISLCKKLIAFFNTYAYIVDSNTYLNTVMYLKLFLTALLVFLASFPHRLILAQDDAAIKLEELIKNPGWSLLKNEKIIDDGKEITMLELLNAFEDNNIISEGPNEPLIRHLTIVLSCDQSKYVRQYIVLVLATIHVCREQKVDGNYSNQCVDFFLKNIKNTDSMITWMLNILTYLYQLSPTRIDIKQFYNALMALKLYSEYEKKTFMKSNFLEAEGKPNEIKIEMKFQEIERIYFFIDLQVQTFAVVHCLPIPESLRQKEIIFQKNKVKLSQNTLKNLVSTYNERFIALGFEHLELYDINTMQTDLQHIWILLEQQQPSDHKIRIRWLGEPKEVTTVLREVASQYSTKNLAAFQKLSLKSITQMFYKKLLVTVQTTFSGIKNKIDEGLCPPNFFTVLRNNWVELKNEHYPAIKEACLSIRHSHSAEECQESFHKSLNRIWLNFIDIKRPAISAACSAVIPFAKVNVSEIGQFISLRLKQLLQSIVLLIFGPATMATYECASDKTDFWGTLKNEIIKFRSVEWPAETTETLETLAFYLENEHKNVNPEDVIRLLELELKTASADFDDKEVSIDVEKPLQIVSNFTDELVELKKSINNVNYSNALLLDAFDFDETVLIKPSKELDNLTVDKVCKLSTKVIKFFDLILQQLNLYKSKKIQISKHVTKVLVSEVKELRLRLPKLVKAMLYHLSKAPRTENINLRSAIVLMYEVSLIYLMDNKTNEVLWQPNQLKRLALLILSQMENYVVQNCSLVEYNKTVINGKLYDMFGLVSRDTLGRIFDSIESDISATQDTLIPLFNNEREVNLSKASIERLVDGDFSPLNCIGELKYQWDGTLQSIKTIQNEVESSINPKKFIMYQSLVQNSGMSVVLGYILNIILAVGRKNVNFNDDQIASILLKVEQFENTVYPISKVDSPRTIFNGFVWCIEQNKISYVRANILKYKIEKKIKSYGIDMTDYYSVMKSNDIISENASGDVQKIYIAPLEVFVDRWVDMFDQDFNCVANYMKLII